MMRVIISGGGTGGHVFPAIAIAHALKRLAGDVDILFIGALGKMEMEKVPAAGFRIEGLPVTGFQRRLTLSNLAFPFRLMTSLWKAKRIIGKFKPDVVIGVGGYASGPTLRIAAAQGIPTLIQEQNSYPGVTNKILATKANRICVAFENMDQFFPAEKILLTGNPIRQELSRPAPARSEALQHFGLEPERMTILAVGGSLGARTINQAILAFGRSMAGESEKERKRIQLLWQTGKYYYERFLEESKDLNVNVVIHPFIDRMDLAYAAADVVISRAGAIAISELCMAGKPVILIPSPNVAEDHQTKNARALEKRGAAILIADNQAVTELGIALQALLNDPQRREQLGRNILKSAIAGADEKIARAAMELAGIRIPDEAATGNTLPETGTIYFLGLGGIGMSALARYFSTMGRRVAGYDRTRTPLTDELSREGMEIHYEPDTGKIPEDTRLVIFTPAVPVTHPEFVYLKNSTIPMKKRAEVLGAITRNYRTVAIAGTHGKTTTSSMVAHILNTAGLPFLAFLGGIARNFGSNYASGQISGKHDETICVVEADEYDRSFLQLHPEVAVITSADADHLDIYGQHEDLLDTFSRFTENIQDRGTLILKEGVSVIPATTNQFSVFGYKVEGEAAFSARNIRLAEGLLNFDLVCPGRILQDMTLNVPGRFNLENAIAAMAVGITLGVGENALRQAMRTYEGVKRRFEYLIRSKELVYIDDYAHHPEELKACIRAVREIYSERRITGIFQPHLYSRTRDFADEFARSLELLDEVLLLEIYPARELPIEGVRSQLLLDKIQKEKKLILQKEELLSYLGRHRLEVLLTLGAGDIDQFVAPITELFTQSGRA